MGIQRRRLLARPGGQEPETRKIYMNERTRVIRKQESSLLFSLFDFSPFTEIVVPSSPMRTAARGAVLQ